MKFDADLSAVDSGTWREYDDSEFLIAHISNLKFQRALARLQQPHKRKLQEGTLDPKVNQQIVCQAMAEGVLLNWRNVTTRDGSEVPYSSEHAAKLLQRDPAFRDWVTDVSTNMANFRAEEVKELGEG